MVDSWCGSRNLDAAAGTIGSGVPGGWRSALGSGYIGDGTLYTSSARKETDEHGNASLCSTLSNAGHVHDKMSHRNAQVGLSFSMTPAGFRVQHCSQHNPQQRVFIAHCTIAPSLTTRPHSRTIERGNLPSNNQPQRRHHPSCRQGTRLDGQHGLP